MAQFEKVMEQFHRMCWYYQRKRECPMGCPMNGVNISQCRRVAFEEPKVTEKTVMQWAAEHPEPVYPTWGEWLIEHEIVGCEPSPRYEEDFTMAHYLKPKINEPIPADIAEKLGIKPKEIDYGT